MLSVDLENRTALARDLVSEAADVARDHRRRGQRTVSKGAQDFVTDADRAIEALIRRAVQARFPGDGFLGEELGEVAPAPDGLTWVIDPIDGTSRYAFGLPEWCISIALCRKKVPIFGLVHAPDLAQTYSAHAGGGALWNGSGIGCSDGAGLEQGLFNLEVSGRDIEAFCAVARRIMERTGGLTRVGSGALALCWVGAGHLRASYDDASHAWDHMAAALIAREAGAWVDLPPDFESGAVLAASEVVWPAAKALIGAIS